MSDKELNLIGYINVDGSNNNITGSINENGSSNNLVGSTINTSLEFVVLKGASAYEVAKNNGYKGTVEEWLDDLRYDHSEEFLEFANGIQNQINALAERHERYEEKFDGLNEKIDSKVIPTKVSEFENDKGYLTEHQDISDLATKKELNDGLVGKSDVGHTHEQYLTEHQSLDEYVRIDSVYGKEEVYSKDETYSKSELYSKEETYSKSEVEEIANNSGKVKTINGVEPDENGNVELKIEEIEIPEQAQADWDEKYESNPSFIKNKPFGYTEQEFEESNFELPYVTYLPKSVYLYNNRNIGLNVRGNIMYNVDGNGNNTYRYSLDFNNIIFDSIYEKTFGVLGDELKLAIQRDNSQYVVRVSISQNPSFNRTIFATRMSIIFSYNKKIESQYIDVPNSDWNEEDESQLSFIKNTQEPKAKLSALDEFFDLEKTRAIMIDMGFIERSDEDDI